MYDPARGTWKKDIPDRLNVNVGEKRGSDDTFGRSEHDEYRNTRVRQHYNSLPNNTHADRRKSEIIGIRDFNNLIKSILIDRYTEPRSIALDLACGKGGDLFKWSKACINGLIGVDIADVSIEHAQQRFKEMRKKTFWADFAAGDAFSTPVNKILEKSGRVEGPIPLVDVVSCQFALHYAFSSEFQARKALENISNALRKGGSFIGTIPNAEYLSAHLQKDGQEWGNSKFKIRFEEPNPEGKFDPPYGHKYWFKLTEAVEDVPEYVVRIDTFKALALEYGLECELFKPFLEFFYDAIEDRDIKGAAIQKGLIDSHTNKVIVNPEEVAAISVYSAFMFKKVQNLD